MNLAEELSRLAELKDRGVLTPKEFDQRKRMLLKGKRPWWMTALLWIIGLWCLVCLLAILVAIVVPVVTQQAGAEATPDESSATQPDSGAFHGKCLLEVQGKKYIDGTCPITMAADGSFSIGADENTPIKFFATVTIEGKGLATGYWNEEEGASHAHSALGSLRFKRGCWSNDVAKVCAWK